MRKSGCLVHRAGLVAGLLFSWCLGVGVVQACDTPVYRYAMYRWFPAPYEVYYFHRDKLDDSATALRARIDKFAELDQVPANMVFLPVDLNKDKELTSVPPDVKKAWLAQKQPTVPSYLVSSPIGVHLHQGQLTEKDLDAMIQSPKRAEVVKQLSRGDAGVFVLLSGDDNAKNDAAEKLLRTVVSDVKSGKVSLYMAPGLVPTDDPDAQPPGLAVGVVKVDRQSKEEKWFVRSLLAVEPDLKEHTGPIVFMLYGRGRALFSCLGEGIERDNLLMDIEFITGACSCTVKDQNPGVDLLFHADWDLAAETLARQFQGEEGSEYAGGGSGYPELMLPGATVPEPTAGDTAEPQEKDSQGDQVADAGTQSTSPATDPGAATEPNAAGAAADTDSGTEAAGHDSSSASTPADTGAADGGAETQLAANRTELDDAAGPGGHRTASAAEDRPASSSFHGVLMVGLGLAAALVVLFGTTFMVLRPK